MRIFIFFILSLMSISGSVNAQSAPQVFTEPVARKQVHDSVEAIGTLKANEQVDLSVNTMEIVRDLHFDDGDRVEKGTLLVEMTDEEENAMLNEARITVDEAKRQYDRLKPLAETGAASESTLDERRREYETAKARYEAVQSRLRDRVIEAPFSGILGLRNVSIGTLVQPGDVVARLIDDSVMKLDFSVPETFLTALKPGLAVGARAPAFRNRLFEGKVSSIDSMIDPVTRSIIVRAEIPNPDRDLKPGLLMTVELKKNQREALVISEEALLAQRGKHFVFRVVAEAQEKRLEKIEVETGSRWPGEVEILSGLNEGDEIVVHGTMKVNEGQTVETSPIKEPLFDNAEPSQDGSTDAS